jgi:hypothetical protein
MYVCLYVCMYVRQPDGWCMAVHINFWSSGKLSVGTSFARAHACVYVRMSVYTHTPLHIHVCIYMSTNTHTHTYMCIYLFIKVHEMLSPDFRRLLKTRSAPLSPSMASLLVLPSATTYSTRVREYVQPYIHIHTYIHTIHIQMCIVHV